MVKATIIKGRRAFLQNFSLVKMREREQGIITEDHASGHRTAVVAMFFIVAADQGLPGFGDRTLQRDIRVKVGP
jgi:hypothetical protein